MLRRGIEIEAVVGVEAGAELEPGAAGHHAPDDRLAAAGVEEPPAGLDGEAASLPVLEAGEEVFSGPDDAKALVVVPHRVGDRELDPGVAANLVVEGPGDVAGRGLEVEHGVEHELELAAPRAEHGVETRPALR